MVLKNEEKNKQNDIKMQTKGIIKSLTKSTKAITILVDTIVKIEDKNTWYDFQTSSDSQTSKFDGLCFSDDKNLQISIDNSFESTVLYAYKEKALCLFKISINDNNSASLDEITLL